MARSGKPHANLYTPLPLPFAFPVKTGFFLSLITALSSNLAHLSTYIGKISLLADSTEFSPLSEQDHLFV